MLKYGVSKNQTADICHCLAIAFNLFVNARNSLYNRSRQATSTNNYYHMRVQDIPIEWVSPAGMAAQELTARFVPRKVGTYFVKVTHNGVHIKDSPWQLTVIADRGRATQSNLFGVPSHFVAGTPVAVKLVAKDVFGNLTSGGDAVTIIADSATEGDTAWQPVVPACMHGLHV